MLTRHPRVSAGYPPAPLQVHKCSHLARRLEVLEPLLRKGTVRFSRLQPTAALGWHVQVGVRALC